MFSIQLETTIGTFTEIPELAMDRQGVTVKEKTAHLICNVLPSWSARVAGSLYGSCVLRTAL